VRTLVDLREKGEEYLKGAGGLIDGDEVSSLFLSLSLSLCVCVRACVGVCVSVFLSCLVACSCLPLAHILIDAQLFYAEQNGTFCHLRSLEDIFSLACDV
jgi:hypothetical protein